MQTDMARLNELIGKNGRAEGELVEANALLEVNFIATLKDLEVAISFQFLMTLSL